MISQFQRPSLIDRAARVLEDRIAAWADRIRVELAIMTTPVGTIGMFGGPTPPDGWLLCDGSEASRDAYPELYRAIGDSWGTAEGTQTFVLPDITGGVLGVTYIIFAGVSDVR